MGIVTANCEDFALQKVSFRFHLTKHLWHNHTNNYSVCYYSVSSPTFSLTFISCMLDKQAPHWMNFPVPELGTLLAYDGICSHLSLLGLLIIDVKNLTFLSCVFSVSSTHFT